MQELIQGTFHFHSTYSHDGRSTLYEIASILRRRGFSFCIMTEHFEDFDALKFNRYIGEVNALNQSGGFVLIPGVEVNLSGVDTIIFPVLEYADIARLASEGKDGQRRMFKVVAHPSKYQFRKLARHLETYDINGIELWNQQTDGRHLPPIRFLESLKTQAWRNHYRYFFGCDLHDVKLTVTNVISLPKPAHLTSEAIVSEVTEGDFRASSLTTGIEYRNGPERADFDTWLETLLKESYYRGKVLYGLRGCLKGLYRMLPQHVQRSLNDFKNFVRNKV
jgi:hypothetical protein